MSLDGFRVAARGLGKQPAFTTVVVLSLALGIALNTTMYGMLDALLHPRLDMHKPEQLYWIRMYGDYKFRVDTRARDAAVANGMHTYQAITRYEPSYRDDLLEHGQNYDEGSVVGVAPNRRACSG